MDWRGGGHVVARNPNKKRCKARSKQTGELCKRWAKEGYEVCHYHGAGGGAPPGNKNGLKTGEHEAIWKDALEDEERVLFDSVQTDVLQQLDNEIRLLEIRERRMLKRIQDVMAGLEAQDVSSKLERSAKKKGDVPVFDESGQMKFVPQYEVELIETERTIKQRPKLERVLAIEEALTRVQDKKAKLLELKHKILTGQKSPGEDPDEAIRKFVDALHQTAEQVWSDDE